MRQPERRLAGGEQREQDRLGRVGDGRQVVAREHRQGLDLGQSFVDSSAIAERPAERDPAGAVDQRRTVRRLDRRRSGDEDARRRRAGSSARWPIGTRTLRSPAGSRPRHGAATGPAVGPSGRLQALEGIGATDIPVGRSVSVDRRRPSTTRVRSRAHERPGRVRPGRRRPSSGSAQADQPTRGRRRSSHERDGARRSRRGRASSEVDDERAGR